MRTNEQRDIIEQLLGITILSEKADNLKEKIKSTKEKITEETAKINAIENSNKKIKETINSVQLRQKAWKKSQNESIEKLQRALDELQQLDIDAEIEAHEKLSQWNELNDQVKSLNKEKATLESALSQADRNLKKINKDIENLDNEICYACGQELHADKHKEILERKQKELSDAQTYQGEVQEKLNKIEKELKDIGDLNDKPQTFYETLKEAYEHQGNLRSLEEAIEGKRNEEDPYQDQISQLENSALQDIDWTRVNELNNYKEHQEFLLKLLTNKDSFIRKKIIDQNLSYLNNRLTHYLTKTGLPHQVVFQNDLSVEITQLGQDLDFDNLSRGERNRLILGMSWAFRDVWESLYQNVNLLFIDELIDSGMDAAGVENCLGILKKMGRDGQKNVFLISHKDELIGRVNHVLRVVKENGFTSYSNDIDVVE
jgi:DNA repair exonuclease SbcCD ATPase subunit